MPAIITHDFFGRDIYGLLCNCIGDSPEEIDAFLLGCQGPDPLFYTVISPDLRPYEHLGDVMHTKKTTDLLCALKNSLSALSDAELAVGRAFALGFLCHYTLDSTMHPYIFFHEYRLCNAGGTECDFTGSKEAHGVIETELDELVLFAKRKETIATFNPSTEILKGSSSLLKAVSKMFVYMALVTYGENIPANMFARGVRDFRFAQHAFYSPRGIKRSLAGKVERLVRPHSFFQSMSHRAIKLTESIYDNHEHKPWKNPFTQEISCASFWDLYDEARTKACKNIAIFDQGDFGLAQAREITKDLNFSGDAIAAKILSVKNI